MNDIMLKAPKGATKKKRRVGRGPGSGRGCTAGKGSKGQNARSGGGVRPGFEGGQMPLFRRIARRGFSNSLFKETFTVINISDLSGFKSDATVNKETLIKHGLIKKSAGNVKLLGNGEINKKLTVNVDGISAKAQEKIEKAGGSVTVKIKRKAIKRKKFKKSEKIKAEKANDKKNKTGEDKA